MDNQEIILPDTSKLIVSSSPHVLTKEHVNGIMRDVIIAMIPACAAGIIFFGISAFNVLLLCTLFCVGLEGLMLKILGKSLNALKDGSAIVTGLLLGMNLAAGTPWWVCFIGSILAIVLAKHLYGGLGYNPFNPALVARVGLLIAFPAQLTNCWPVNRFGEKAAQMKEALADLISGDLSPIMLQNSGQFTKEQYLAIKDAFLNKTTLIVDTVTSATPLDTISHATVNQQTGLVEGMPVMEYMDYFMGYIGGCIGETSALAILIGGAYLIYRRLIRWQVPFFYILTVLLITGIMHMIHPDMSATPLFHILTGGLMLGAFFMATDMVTSPVSAKGAIIYAVGCGLITSVIRLWGSYPEGVSFSILFMNAFVPLIDRISAKKVFGSKEAAQGGAA